MNKKRGRIYFRTRGSRVRGPVTTKILILIAAVFTATAFAPVGGARQAQAQAGTERIVEGALEQANEAVEQAMEAAKRAEARAGRTDGAAEGEGSGPGAATLRIEGEPGTEFSGSCSVGAEEHELSGRVPQTFRFELNGRELECEIHQRSAGSLKVVLEAGNDRLVQRVDSPDDTIRFAYSGNAISSTTVSSSSSSSVSQTVSSVVSSSQTQVVVSSE